MHEENIRELEAQEDSQVAEWANLLFDANAPGAGRATKSKPGPRVNQALNHDSKPLKILTVRQPAAWFIFNGKL